MSRRPKSTDDPPAKRRKKHHKVVEEEEEDDENIIDLSQAPGFINLEDQSPEVGIIERVVVKNFLCHQHQDIKFSPRVNFIIGNNGSGKSAIMTAIIVGLGGKASTTTRGNSVKNFVKHGETSAKVAITVNNRGEDAFKPQLYGDSITVERRLAASGVHGAYTLKSASGSVISQKKDELVFMLDQLNIQVDNPVSILTQDTSKHFLHSKSEKDKYQFFMRATQLEQMHADYLTANQHKKRANDILAVKEKELPELEKEVRVLEEKAKAFDAIEDLRQKVIALRNELAWSIVANKEKAVEPVRKELKMEEARMPKFKAKVTEQENKLSECVARKADIETRIAQMTSDVEGLVPRHNALKAAKDEKRKIVRQKQADMQSQQRELSRLQKDRKNTQDRIEEIQSQVVADFEVQKQQRDARIQQLEEQLDELQAQMKTTEHVMQQFRSAVARNKHELAEMRHEERELEQQKDGIAREIQELQGTRANKLRRFGKDMPEICKQVDNAHKRGVFHAKPRGPFGAHINVKDPAWAVAVEVSLEGLINAFCVTDHHDEKELEKIFKRVCNTGRKPVIITNKFTTEIFDVTKYKPRTQYPTVFDMLDLQDADPVVINNLIDQKSIESILLIETPTMITEFNKSNPSKLVKMAYTQQGDQAFFSPTFRYYSLPKERTSSVLTSNLEDAIKRLQQAQLEAARQLQEKRTEIRGKDNEMKENLRQERSHHTSLNKIRDQSNKVNLEVQDLKSVEDDVAPDVTSLEDDVARFDEQIVTLTEALQTKSEKLTQAKEHSDVAEKEFVEVDKQMREITGSLEPIQNELAEIQEDMETAKRHRKHYASKQQELEKAIATIRERLDVVERDASESVAKAEQVCERIRTRRTPQNIESEILQIEKQISVEEKNRGNREEIQRKYVEAYEKLEIIKRTIRVNKSFLRKLDAVMVRREQNFLHFRKLLGVRTKYGFITYLNQRKYQGKLHFDHANQTIKILVQPTQNAQQAGGSKDMRSLSGGERSYSTVCFVLALWDAIESPFRMMDEFDVFMDMVNRRVSMDMLLEAARAGLNKRRQFIFLTPQDMISNLPADVRILRMRPPVRDGQTTIDQYAANNGVRGEEDD